MLVFFCIAIAGFIVTGGAMLFGHDHDADHGDIGHDADHGEVDSSGESTVSVFSVKVLSTFVTAFGAAGAIARYNDLSYMASCLWGVASGVVFAALMFGLLRLMYKQQGATVIHIANAIGQTGVIEISIPKNGTGQTGLTVDGAYGVYNSLSKAGNPIPKGRTVKVVETKGNGLLIVEPTEL